MTSFFKNGSTPASFCNFFVLFQTQILQKNSTRQRDSNSDCRSTLNTWPTPRPTYTLPRMQTENVQRVWICLDSRCAQTVLWIIIVVIVLNVFNLTLSIYLNLSVSQDQSIPVSIYLSIYLSGANPVTVISLVRYIPFTRSFINSQSILKLIYKFINELQRYSNLDSQRRRLTTATAHECKVKPA